MDRKRNPKSQENDRQKQGFLQIPLLQISGNARQINVIRVLPGGLNNGVTTLTVKGECFGDRFMILRQGISLTTLLSGFGKFMITWICGQRAGPCVCGNEVRFRRVDCSVDDPQWQEAYLRLGLEIRRW